MIRPAFISQGQWLINLGRGDVRRNLRKQQQRTKIVYSRDTTQPTVNGVRKLTHPSQSVPRFLCDFDLMSRARLTIIQFVKIKLIPSAPLSTLIATHSEHEPTLLARHRNIVVWMTLGRWSNPCLLHVLRLMQLGGEGGRKTSAMQTLGLQRTSLAAEPSIPWHIPFEI